MCVYKSHRIDWYVLWKIGVRTYFFIQKLSDWFSIISWKAQLVSTEIQHNFVIRIWSFVNSVLCHIGLSYVKRTLLWIMWLYSKASFSDIHLYQNYLCCFPAGQFCLGFHLIYRSVWEELVSSHIELANPRLWPIPFI